MTERITENGSFSIPVTGDYKIIAIGGGGGGAGGTCINDTTRYVIAGGGAGGEGGKYIGTHFLKKGTVIDITIGKGGSAGIKYDLQASQYHGTYVAASYGGNATDTIVKIDGTNYIAGGGKGGIGAYGGGQGGRGGEGIINGSSGMRGGAHIHNGSSGANGGLGGLGYGGGGDGGSAIQYNTYCGPSSNGSNGRNGVVIISYAKLKT